MHQEKQADDSYMHQKRANPLKRLTLTCWHGFCGISAHY